MCGGQTRFFYQDAALYRESLYCARCLTTSRYRSIARGVLRAIGELAGIRAASLRALAASRSHTALRVYDTQAAFYVDTCAYPIPDLLNACEWIEAEASLFRPDRPLGSRLHRRVTNQNLEALTFADASFDIVMTSDVMEHVRLDVRAHREIRRILRPGGVYLFTVPHVRDRRATDHRVAVVDPADPGKDIDMKEREYHGDANAVEGRALSYRAYGTDLDELLEGLGFVVEYDKADVAEAGILNTELFYCRLRR